MHSKKELRDALIYLCKNPLSITPHELIPFDTPTIDIHTLMHILGLEKRKFWKKKFKKMVDGIAGFHFSLNERMDKYLKNKVVDKMTGVAKATVDYAGMIKDGKTFFPPSLTLEKLLNEMQAAMLNLEQVTESGSRIILAGRSSAGITIEMVFEKTGKLVTAYPILKS